MGGPRAPTRRRRGCAHRRRRRRRGEGGRCQGGRRMRRKRAGRGRRGKGKRGRRGRRMMMRRRRAGSPSRSSARAGRWVASACVPIACENQHPSQFPTTQPPKQNKNAQTCGFIRGDPGCEMGPSGQATLRGIAHFCRRFPCIAAEMAFQYSHHGKRGQTVSFPALCGLVRGLGEGCVRGCQSLWTRRDGSPKKTHTHEPSYEQQCPHTHHDRPTLLLHPPPNTQR